MLSNPTTADSRLGGVHQRRSKRHSIETLAYAELGPENGGFSINVSEWGLAFQGIQLLEKNQVIQIKFKLPGIKDILETTGQVIWLNDTGKGGGLKFIDVPEKSCSLINDWLSLQMQPGERDETFPDGSQQVETKKSQLFTPFSSMARSGNTLFAPNANVDTNPIVPSSPSVRVSGSLTKATVSTGFRRPADTKQEKLQETGGKRTWIMPFTIGLATSAAIMFVTMVFLGVISVQFHLPQRTMDLKPAPPAAESGAAIHPEFSSGSTKIDKSSDVRSAPGPPALTVPPSVRAAEPTINSAAPKLEALKPSSERMSTAGNINPPKTSLQQVAATKLRAMRPLTPTGSGDFVAPSIALQTNSELVPRLPMMSSLVPAPALPVNAPAQQNSRFDPPQLITRRDPVYPREAKANGIRGSVELHFTINAEGNVHQVSVVTGNMMLGRAAIEAVQSWHYQPAKLNGIAVETDSSVVFNFVPN